MNCTEDSSVIDKRIPEGEYVSQRLRPEFLGVIALSLVLGGPPSYDFSSFASRLVLVSAFAVVLISLTLAGYRGRERIALSMLLRRSSFIMPHYIEGVFHSPTYIWAQQFGEQISSIR